MVRPGNPIHRHDGVLGDRRSKITPWDFLALSTGAERGGARPKLRLEGTGKGERLTLRTRSRTSRVQSEGRPRASADNSHAAAVPWGGSPGRVRTCLERAIGEEITPPGFELGDR